MTNCKQLALALLLGLSSLSAWARPDEGMWLPMLLKQLNESDMQKKGMRLSAEDIYSINKSSLKDAVVQFGSGCTGEVISNQGLLLTNHHCGYGQIQSHSTVENDYLTNGFWAMSKDQEKPNPGLTATFIVRMEDVTKLILGDIPGNLTEAEREQRVTANIKKVQYGATNGTHYGAIIRPFFYGTEYYMYITETFRDIRLVGAPPESIGKFGGDTDNWMWPRHTGDFSIFRIYAGPDNKPADYSPNNKPYTPKHHLPISLAGIKPGDFTLVFGFPGRTTEYLPSQAVSEIVDISDPAKIKIRTMRLHLLEQEMLADPKIRIQYAAKYASVSNSHKKWIGEMRGLKKLDAVAKKKDLEKQFAQWVSQETGRKSTYGHVLPHFDQNYTILANDITLTRDYYQEAALGIELLSYAQSYLDLAELIQKGNQTEQQKADIQAYIQALLEAAPAYFKNYSQATDKKVFASLLEMYAIDIADKYQPVALTKAMEGKKFTWAGYADKVYGPSNLVSLEKVTALLKMSPNAIKTKLLADPAINLLQSFNTVYYTDILPVFNQLTEQNTLLNRLYLQGLREMQKDKKFYPDANSTLRISYGQVEGYKPTEDVTYDYYTTLEGLIEKADMTEVPDYKIPKRLRELHVTRDYGLYALNGKMPVAFIASNHTTGGNSGSPVINGRGELIGLNFDRNWEGTMSDIMYDPERVRNISLNMNYLLFIIDKFAGAGHLVQEMNVIYPKADAAPVPRKEPVEARHKDNIFKTKKKTKQEE
ncbi:S46 family peptidase [Nibribacter koreensis]|uniref:Dipeptidyl-peptidase n=1 Tax=Nibribacter koreensis TaxID=1084519 RepID=A0ABP8F865_9BACT